MSEFERTIYTYKDLLDKIDLQNENIEIILNFLERNNKYELNLNRFSSGL
jgi:hypothetical protein